MKKLLFLYLLFFVIVNQFSQDRGLTFKILDSITKEPVSFATIILKKTNRATHADIDGVFKIPIKYYEKGILRISSIGFTSKEIILSNFKEDKINIVLLSTHINDLKEIVVVSKKKKWFRKRLKAKDIVAKAIKNILENYPTNPHSFAGYYRDYQQPISETYKKYRRLKTNPRYVNLNEGIIEIFDQGFQTDKFSEKKNQSLLYNYKTNKNFLIDPLLKIPYDNIKNKFSKNINITPFGGNELNILNVTNAIRNHARHSFSFANVFDKDFVKNHKFKKEGIKNMNNVSLYEISFKAISRKTNLFHKAIGTIYISKYNYEIYKLDYSVFDLSSKKPRYTVTLEYLPKGNKMYLNYMMFNNLFTVKDNNFFKMTSHAFDPEGHVLYLYFNKQINENTIGFLNKNVRVYLNNKYLEIEEITVEQLFKKTLIIKIKEKDLTKSGIFNEKQNPNNKYVLDVKLKKIQSLDGYIINDQPIFSVHQFREFFVQEVFENKDLPIQKNYIDKFLPLSKMMITPVDLKNNYWLNTPLKSSK